MTIDSVGPWLMAKPTRWAHLQRVPMRHLWSMLTAAFLVFSVVGFYIDVLNGGVIPYPIVLASALVSGLDAVLWVLVLARMPMYCLVILIVLQFFIGQIHVLLARWLDAAFHFAAIDPQTGLHFAGTSILIAVLASFIFFSRYTGLTGKQAMRIQNELELAHSIQKTLVPPISTRIGAFEIYGISEPSEKVGGDLVDVVTLANGDGIAYLADIAGHGLQAGILMGMLKTAARTALADGKPDGGATLSMLMDRLNVVLPQVKEAHMYATFTVLRLNLDGLSFYGMAASTPLLHWSAAARTIRRVEEQQFPLGLLPVSEFRSSQLTIMPGDVLAVATDGILEVNQQGKPLPGTAIGEEFGIEAFENLMAQHAEAPLPKLASSLLQAVRSYGQQVDDQTLLLVRRTT